MLAKLLKYEIPAMGRKLGPLFAAWSVASLLLGISIGSLNGSGFFEILAPIIYFMVTTAVFVMYIILIIQRFSSSMLGDEAYFNLTLPVSTTEHIANKALSALIWTMITGFAALASILIIGLTSGDMNDIFNMQVWREFIDELSKVKGSVVLVITEILIVGIFSTVKSILAIYAAITIGHQAKQHTTLASVGAYIVLMIAESMVGNIFINMADFMESNLNYHVSATAEDSLNIFISDMAAFNAFMLVGLIVSLALSAAYFFICKYLMERRLNLA